MKRLAILLLVFFVAACISNPYQRNYNGFTFNFRADLNEAEKVAVYPSEQAVKDLLLSRTVNKIALAYIDNADENGYYAVDGFEFSYKMTIINRVLFGGPKDIEVYNVSSMAEAKNLSDKIVPVVMFLGPSLANKTAITVDGSTILVEGKELYVGDRTYTDLDLATDKLILILMSEQ
jgi:hypothetical protein